jgi:hypothetical protein
VVEHRVGRPGLWRPRTERGDDRAGIGHVHADPKRVLRVNAPQAVTNVVGDGGEPRRVQQPFAGRNGTRRDRRTHVRTGEGEHVAGRHRAALR